MAIKFWDYLKLKNGDKAAFIPPAPNGAQRGGITGTQETQIATNASNITSLNQAIVNYHVKDVATTDGTLTPDANGKVTIPNATTLDYGLMLDKRYVLLNTITLTEPVASIVRSADDNGNAYNLSSFFIRVKDFGATDTKWVLVQANSDSKYLDTTTNDYRYIDFFSNYYTYSRYCALGIHNANGLCKCWCNMNTTNTGFVSGYSDNIGSTLFGDSPIRSIIIKWQGGDFPAGTVADIYGVWRDSE